MIEFEINPQYYKEIHNAIIAVDDECKLNFTENQLKTVLVDPSNVLMGFIEVDKLVFKSYNVDEIKTVGYSLNCVGNSNELNMLLDSETNHTFSFYQKGDKSKMKLTYDIFTDKITLPEIAQLRRQPKIPNLEMSCYFDLPVSMLKKITKRGEFFRFVIEDNHLICDGESVEDDIKWHTKPIHVNSTNDATSKYSIDYIKDIVEAIPKDIDMVKISMGTDYPCTIEFNICDGMVPVMYLLAPRIQSE